MFACGIIRQSKCAVYRQPWNEHFQNSAFGRTEYTTNMAACYDIDMSDVTSPHIIENLYSPNCGSKHTTAAYKEINRKTK